MRPPRQRLPLPKDRLALGTSGLTVSPFCLGLVRDWRTIPAAYDAGINFFFVTADMHWPLYEQTRKGLTALLSRGGGVRDDITVAGCTYVAQSVFLYYPFQEIIDATPGLARIDCFVAGGAYTEELRARWPIFLEHKKGNFLGGKAIGVSYHDRKAAIGGIGSGELDVGYIRYNPLHPGAASDLLPHLPDERSTLVYNFKSTFGAVSEKEAKDWGLPEEFWIPAAPDYYRFVLTRPEIDGILCALDVPEHAESLAESLGEGPVSPEEEEHFKLLGELIHRRRPKTPPNAAGAAGG